MQYAEAFVEHDDSNKSLYNDDSTRNNHPIVVSKDPILPSLANNKSYLSTDVTNRRLYAFELMPLNLPQSLSSLGRVV